MVKKHCKTGIFKTLVFVLVICNSMVLFGAGAKDSYPVLAGTSAEETKDLPFIQPMTSTKVSGREIANSKISLNAATQGMVLLENENNALPIQKNGNIALFGSGSYYTISGGTGSGDVNERETVNVEQGFQNAGYTVTTTEWIDAYGKAWNEGYEASKHAINYMLTQHLHKEVLVFFLCVL